MSMMRVLHVVMKGKSISAEGNQHLAKLKVILKKLGKERTK